MSTKDDFIALLNSHGSLVQFHRGDSLIPCPCRTPEGFRDPEWHLANPGAPVCDENGMLPDPANTTDLTVRAFVQPSQSTRATRLSPEYVQQLFGEIQEGDHIGLFPESWEGKSLNFYDWGQSGEDWVKYNNRFYNVVAANLFAAPDTGDPRHHWEVGLRLRGEPING